MPMPMPMQQMGGMGQPGQGGQQPMNMQMFAQLLQQMGGGQPPNLQAGPPPGGMPGQPQAGMQPGMQQASMGQPQMGPQPGGMPPMPQQKPPVPQMMPPMPQQKPPVPPPGAPQFGGVPPSPMGAGANNVPTNQFPQVPMQQMQPGAKFSPQELGALGRFGDTTVAHLTPGEITIPPQVQTPKILATLKHEYHKKGVDPSQFTVGSPNSSVNPRTGVPEYNFFSSLLPMALGIGGSLLLPGLGTGLTTMAASALGGGLGTAAGGLLAGQDPMTAGLTGLGSGLGGYALGSLLSPAASAAGQVGANQINPVTGGMGGSTIGATAPLGGQQMGDAGLNDVLSRVNPTDLNNPAAYSAASPTQQLASDVSGQAAQGSGGLTGTIFDKLIPQNASDIGQALGSTAGGALGGMLASGIMAGNQPVQPKGFDTPYKNASQLPGWQDLIGQSTYKGPTPNFTGYNPATNYPAAFNFFPTTKPATA